MSSTLQSMPGIGGSRGLNDSFPSLFLIVEPRKRLKAWLPAASATASCRSRSRSWLVSLDGEILVFVASVEAASDAKDVLPALKLLTKSKAVKIEVTPWKRQRSCQRSGSGIEPDAFGRVRQTVCPNVEKPPLRSCNVMESKSDSIQVSKSFDPVERRVEMSTLSPAIAISSGLDFS